MIHAGSEPIRDPACLGFDNARLQLLKPWIASTALAVFSDLRPVVAKRPATFAASVSEL
jgi:hypothetical protein